MVILERLIQKVRPGKWPELEVLDKKFEVAEGAAGFPPKKRYACLAGGYHTDTLVIEREWESLAAIEVAYTKVSADPAYQQAGAELLACLENTQRELYGVLP